MHVALFLLSTQFLCRVMIFKYYCHSCLFFVLITLPTICGESPNRTGPPGPHFYCIGVLIPYYLLSASIMRAFSMSICLPLVYFTPYTLCIIKFHDYIFHESYIIFHCVMNHYFNITNLFLGTWFVSVFWLW